MEKLRENKVSNKILCHATYKPFLKSILEKGLGNTKRKMWADSKGKGVVYLAEDEDIAYSFAETAEWLDDVEDYDKYVDHIIIIAISVDALDKSKLIKDENTENQDTWEYHGIIPKEAFVKIWEPDTDKVFLNESKEKYEEYFYSVKKDNKIVARYGLSIYHDTKDVDIGSLVVEPEYRDQGIATSIINKVINKWSKKGYSVYCFVDKDNYNAISLYKKLGNLKNTNKNQYIVWFYNNHESLNESRKLRENEEQNRLVNELDNFLDKFELATNIGNMLQKVADLVGISKKEIVQEAFKIYSKYTDLYDKVTGRFDNWSAPKDDLFATQLLKDLRYDGTYPLEDADNTEWGGVVFDLENIKAINPENDKAKKQISESIRRYRNLEEAEKLEGGKKLKALALALLVGLGGVSTATAKSKVAKLTPEQTFETIK